MKLSILSSNNKAENSININNQNIRFEKDDVFYVKSFWNKKTGKYEQKTIYGTILGPSEVNGEVIFKPNKGTNFSVSIKTLENNNIQKITDSDIKEIYNIKEIDSTKIYSYQGKKNSNPFLDNIRHVDSANKKSLQAPKKDYISHNIKNISTSKVRLINTISYYKKISAILLIGLLSYKGIGNSATTSNKNYQDAIKKHFFDNLFTVNDSLTYNPKLSELITAELKYFKSPVTYNMIHTMAKKYDIDINMLMTFMRNDSQYGTKGLAVKTKNPGNVGNMDEVGKIQKLHFCSSWEEGVEICAAHLAKVSAVYEKKFGKKPSSSEIANGISLDGIRFWGVYMTAPNGPEVIKIVAEKLSKKGIQGTPLES